jgi:hypothetical protein
MCCSASPQHAHLVPGCQRAHSATTPLSCTHMCRQGWSSIGDHRMTARCQHMCRSCGRRCKSPWAHSATSCLFDACRHLHPCSSGPSMERCSWERHVGSCPCRRMHPKSRLWSSTLQYTRSSRSTESAAVLHKICMQHHTICTQHAATYHCLWARNATTGGFASHTRSIPCIARLATGGHS